MIFRSDDTVWTADGKSHRVIYACEKTKTLFVKTNGDKKRKGHRIAADKVVAFDVKAKVQQ